MSKEWSNIPFITLYDAIEGGQVELVASALSELKQDLTNLLLYPPKSDSSRKSLESGKVKFTSGDEYELNKEFIIATVQLSDELDLDELIAAEINYNVSVTDEAQLVNSLFDGGKASFYMRRRFILLIVSYLTNVSDFGSHFVSKELIDNLLKSYQVIEKELESIKQLVARTKILNGNIVPRIIQDGVDFRRNFLFKEHQLLGEIIHGVANNNFSTITNDQFNTFVSRISSIEENDVFSLSYIPIVFDYFTHLNDLPDSVVEDLHSGYLKELEKENVSVTLALVTLVFLIYFVNWCKEKDLGNTKYEFTSSVQNPLLKCIELGALEKFMAITITLSKVDNSPTFFDFRSLLQNHIPELTLQRLSDDESTKIEVVLEDNFKELLVSILNTFVQDFISNGAFLLTHLRNTEEDILLANEDILEDLDALAENADLERFYLSIYYLYYDRSNICTQFWSDKDSNAYGFLKWASVCNSPLISSTYCLVLSALSSGEANSVETFNFLTQQNSQNIVSGPGLNSRISWKIIYEALNYYNKALLENGSNGIAPGVFSQNFQESVIPELGEDSVIFIAGYFQLISSIANNSEITKLKLFENDLLKMLFEFLESATQITAPTLLVLRSLIGTNIESRHTIWRAIDNWIFNFPMNRHYLSSTKSFVAKDVFFLSLRTFDEINAFVGLIEALLKPVQTEDTTLLDLTFPVDLGSTTRKNGVWSYLEFFTEELLVNSNKTILAPKSRIALQSSLLTCFKHCLTFFDNQVIISAQVCGLQNLNSIVKCNDFFKFISNEPGSIVTYYLYEKKVYDVLLDIASLGIDELTVKNENSKEAKLLYLSLEVIDLLLEKEPLYIDEVVPLMKKSNMDLGTRGLSSFYDIFLFRLPVLIHIGLYIGSQHLSIARKSLQILSKISLSPQFSAGSSFSAVVKKNRLLSTFETVDESIRLRNSIIDQLENPNSLALKIEILEFLNNNLSSVESTVSHFFIGFDTRNSLGLGNTQDLGTIASTRSTLKTLVLILVDTLQVLTEGKNIPYNAIRILKLIFDILLRLLKNSNTSSLITGFLRNDLQFNFFKKVCIFEPKIDLQTQWDGLLLDPALSLSNSFICESYGAGALLAFISQRALLLELLSLELHNIASTGSISARKSYVDPLIGSSELNHGFPRILDFLDFLNLNLINKLDPLDNYYRRFDFDYILKTLKLRTITLDSDERKSIFELNSLNQMVELVHLEEGDKSSSTFEERRNYLVNYFSNSIFHTNFKEQQFKTLHAWVTLVQIIVNEGNLTHAERSNFILEVFQSIVPRINDYIDIDIQYTEELMTLVLLLVDSYEKDRKSFFTNNETSETTNSLIDSSRLYPLFKISIDTILSPLSTGMLRSKAYVLISKFLNYSEINKGVCTEALISIRSHDAKLLSLVCNDSIMGEGEPRITSMLLLDALVKISSRFEKNSLQSNFVMDHMIKTNFFLMLIRSIKRTDEIFSLCFSKKGPTKVPLDVLLYELTAFKTTIYFLIRVAKTKIGAQQLVNGDVFGVIKGCKFLAIDPDLGVELQLVENHDQTVRLRLSLDSPLNVSSTVGDKISYFELLVPVFQLTLAVVISLAGTNKNAVNQVQGVMKHFKTLVVGVLKREVLIEKEGSQAPNPENYQGLKQLSLLFTQLNSIL
ncbi:BA75_02154T0 [Komagataella pastoris]|uniref:BA75_02154T0 n=1 Tax=Komagataella pastoris TaxID=4922 RepID=A0A1B2JAW0_PICPA|nr:BA75_02154T0 [Komagataella pastoris]